MSDSPSSTSISSGSQVSKVLGLVGITATLLGNIAAIATHFDSIRAVVLKWLGATYLFEVHRQYVFFFMFVIGSGYLLCSIWAYRNYLYNRSVYLKLAFCALSLFAVSTLTFGSYWLFRPIDIMPVLTKATSDMMSTVLTRQVENAAETDNGGFRFWQTGATGDPQVWTTAQCLAALLTADSQNIRNRSSVIKNGFKFIEQKRILGSFGGWGYMSQSSWAVTEINSWVLIAYVLSLKTDVAKIVWSDSELTDVVVKTIRNSIAITNRQNNDGGWGPIEKTNSSVHNRTYSTAMSLWAIIEVLRTPIILQEMTQEDRVQLKTTLKKGIEWILDNYNINSDSSGGWWPNPSIKKPTDFYHGLTAQVFYTIKRAEILESSLFAKSKYYENVSKYLSLELDGSKDHKRVMERDMSDNQRMHDSDIYLDGRRETIEPSTFLWWPWTFMLVEELKTDPRLNEDQKNIVSRLSNILNRRVIEFKVFAESDPVIYPTAEGVIAINWALTKSRALSGTLYKAGTK